MAYSDAVDKVYGDDWRGIVHILIEAYDRLGYVPEPIITSPNDVIDVIAALHALGLFDDVQVRVGFRPGMIIYRWS